MLIEKEHVTARISLQTLTPAAVGPNDDAAKKVAWCQVRAARASYPCSEQIDANGKKGLSHCTELNVLDLFRYCLLFYNADILCDSRIDC